LKTKTIYTSKETGEIFRWQLVEALTRGKFSEAAIEKILAAQAKAERATLRMTPSWDKIMSEVRTARAKTKPPRPNPILAERRKRNYAARQAGTKSASKSSTQ